MTPQNPIRVLIIRNDALLTKVVEHTLDWMIENRVEVAVFCHQYTNHTTVTVRTSARAEVYKALLTEEAKETYRDNNKRLYNIEGYPNVLEILTREGLNPEVVRITGD